MKGFVSNSEYDPKMETWKLQISSLLSEEKKRTCE